MKNDKEKIERDDNCSEQPAKEVKKEKEGWYTLDELPEWFQEEFKKSFLGSGKGQ